MVHEMMNTHIFIDKIFIAAVNITLIGTCIDLKNHPVTSEQKICHLFFIDLINKKKKKKIKKTRKTSSPLMSLIFAQHPQFTRINNMMV